MPETKSLPSKGASQLAMDIYAKASGPSSAASLIDAALATLMQAAKDHADACSLGDECALATALAPWEPESGVK